MRTLTLFSLICLANGIVYGAMIDVTINTAPLIGHPAGPFFLDFELDDGGESIEHGLRAGALSGPLEITQGDGNNTVTISNFQFFGGGALGIPDLSGGASGNLSSAVTLTDTSFFNNFTQQFKPGSQLKFRLTYSNNLDPGDIPDIFDFAILDGSGVEIPTLGGEDIDSLVEVVFDSPDPTVRTFATDPSRFPPGGGLPIRIAAPTAAAVVPEPGTLVLLGAGLGGVMLMRNRRYRMPT